MSTGSNVKKKKNFIICRFHRRISTRLCVGEGGVGRTGREGEWRGETDKEREREREKERERSGNTACVGGRSAG